MRASVYWIIYLPTKKVYIGSTVRLASKRWIEHKTRLTCQRHNNTYLQRAWNKHGPQHFVFEILQTCDTEKVLQVEQDWLDRVKLDGYSVYNGSSLITSTFLGKHHTEETRRKLSAANKGKPSHWLGRKRTQEHTKILVRSRAGAYPTLINMFTKQIISAGENIAKMCRDHSLVRRTIQHLINHETVQTRDGWRIQ